MSAVARSTSEHGTAGKLARIEQLAAHGLNTPRLTLLERGTRFDRRLRERLRAEARGAERMTVRTYHPEDETTYAKGPFAPEVPVEEAIDLAESFAAEWNVLFQEAIDVADTVVAGNLVVAADGSGAYEVLEGPYRVREVEEPSGDARHALRTGSFDAPEGADHPWVRRLVERVVGSALLDDVTEDVDERIVVEFNVQARPVGRRGEQLLLWEWRPLQPSARRRTLPARVPLPQAPARPAVFALDVPGLDAPPVDDRLAARLGGKGAGLVRAHATGIPVPPALLLAAVSGSRQRVPAKWLEGLDERLSALVAAASDSGISRRGTLAVRSSPAVSMPGMLETVLDVPVDPSAVAEAIARVLRSWRAERASVYRAAFGIAEDAGLGVVVQPMVDVTADRRSGSGFAFTRDPRTGAAGVVLEFLERRLGSDLARGTGTPMTADQVRERIPALAADLDRWAGVLERAFRDAQEFELAVEAGRPFLVQSRAQKRTALATLRIAYDLARDGVISDDEARAIADGVDLGTLLERRLDAQGADVLATATVASPGVAVGRLAVSRSGVTSLAESGEPVVFAATTVGPADYPVVRRTTGFVSRQGGITSHASVVALAAGVTALVGCGDLEVDTLAGTARFGERVLREGDWLSLEGASAGRVYAGALRERPPRPVEGVAPEVLAWARTSASDGTS